MRRLILSLMLAAALPASLPAQSLKDIPSPKPLTFPPDTLSVFFIGDVMMHSAQLDRDCTPFLANIAPAMKKADIAVANMEFSLGGEPYTGYPAFSAPDYYAEYVHGCGADIFLTANNHILDRRSAGLARTIGVYRSMRDSIMFTGVADSDDDKRETYPLMVECKEFRLALVNFTYGTNGIEVDGWPNVNYMDEEDVSAAIARAKEKKAHFIIVLPHWGEEYQLRHSPNQGKWAEWLAGQGVDAIVGSHPHVVQDTAHVGGIPVIYSMGNAVSNMSVQNSRLELAVILKFTRDCMTGRRKMLEPEIRYMWCTLPGTLTDNYATIFVKEWSGRRDEWINKSDYDNMMDTYERVKSATGAAD